MALLRSSDGRTQKKKAMAADGDASSLVYPGDTPPAVAAGGAQSPEEAGGRRRAAMKGAELKTILKRKTTTSTLLLSRMINGQAEPEQGGDGSTRGAARSVGARDEEENDEEDEEEDEEEEEEGDGESSGKAGKRPPIYNVAGLHEKLEDFGWTAESDWLEAVVMTHADATPEQVDVNDDLAREVAFYSQAADCAKEALLRLKALGVPVVRPKDYYAEMVKGDAHMTRVQAKLLSEQKEMEEKEERRKQRETKKYSKEVQAEKQKERQKAKKDEIQAVEKWRKMRANTGFEDGGDVELPIGLGDEGAGKGGRSPGKRKPLTAAEGTPPGKVGAKRGPSKKRVMKDSKFGFGGRKRLKKQNDGESFGDMDGFRAGRAGEKTFSGKGKQQRSPGKGKGTQQRPGKARRQQMRAGKK